jgi:predicted nucleic acid-binding protein
MLLVDSSVWIDRSLGVETDGTRFVDERDGHEDIAVMGVIYQEVLQGASSERGFDALRTMMSAMLLLEPRELSTYEIAADLYRRAHKAGFTVRSPNDCLIAAVALENGALLVHNDRDFLSLAQVEPALMIYPGRPH